MKRSRAWWSGSGERSCGGPIDELHDAFGVSGWRFGGVGQVGCVVSGFGERDRAGVVQVGVDQVCGLCGALFGAVPERGGFEMAQSVTE